MGIIRNNPFKSTQLPLDCMNGMICPKGDQTQHVNIHLCSGEAGESQRHLVTSWTVN